MHVPQFQIPPLPPAYRERLARSWERIVEGGHFIGGEENRLFEKEFADFLGIRRCTALANGTDALTLSLRALGVGKDDEIIVPGMTFFATVEAVLLAGATPVFADVDLEDFNLSASSLEDRIGPRTVGVIGVHLYGTPFDLDSVMAICDRRNLWLLEDAAQAHGARWNGRRVGTFGAVSAWSFYPSKNLGCFGDGGAVTSNDVTLADHVAVLGNHGQSSRSWHEYLGHNSRLDSLQAAVLRLRLELLDEQNQRRREIALRYERNLGDCEGVRFPSHHDQAEPVYHQLVIITPRRIDLARFLEAAGIQTAVHYPHAVHDQPALGESRLPHDALPIASRIADEALSLPMFPTLTNDQIDYVCDSIRSFFGCNA